MTELRNATDGKSDKRESNTNYSIEWWAMFLAFFASGGIVCEFKKSDYSMIGTMVLSVAVFSFALVVVAIVDARKLDRAKFHDRKIEEAKAEREKAEAEAEDKKCEAVMNNHGRSDSMVMATVLTIGKTAGRNDPDNTGGNRPDSKDKQGTIPSNG